MKYFLTESERKERGGTCYHEFYKGEWDADNMVFWSSDSMNIHDDMMYNLGLDEFFEKVLGNYNISGENAINKIQWDRIYNLAEVKGGALFDAIKEINPWVEDNFRTNEVFTILGI